MHSYSYEIFACSAFVHILLTKFKHSKSKLHKRLTCIVRGEGYKHTKILKEQQWGALESAQALVTVLISGQYQLLSFRSMLSQNFFKLYLPP